MAQFWAIVNTMLHLKEVYDRDGPTVSNDDYFLEASISNEVQEKTFVFGMSRIDVGGRTFNYRPVASNLDKEHTEPEFVGSDLQDKVYMNVNSAADPVLRMLNGHVVLPTPGVSGTTSTSDATQWGGAFYNLITDRTIASVPQDSMLRYAGDASFLGGSGQPLSDGKSTSELALVCPVAFTVNAQSGRISAMNVTCSDSGASGTITVAPLTVRASRITSLLNDEFSASASGPSTRSKLLTPPTVSAVMKSSKVAGMLYGSNAELIILAGSGPNGIVTVFAQRVSPSGAPFARRQTLLRAAGR